ncbi:MAG: hypothetical protein HC888_18285 [Candidatus Competibacteraceae bacterium]|nr:hypothetical protein [Candidatus Competibacteraceae bacterium]
MKPKQFIIFFGFDRCDITAEADRVLTDAANTAKAAARPIPCPAPVITAVLPCRRLAI